MNQYVEDVLRRDVLHDEIERIRKFLVRIHANPLPIRAEQREVVIHATKMFQALLMARDIRLRTEG
jgi:hypothetical protein